MAQMSRTLPLLPPSIAFAAALLLIYPFDVSLARDTQTADVAQIGEQVSPHAGESAPAAANRVPRWFEEVRAQRQALQEQRRAQYEARRRAIDPVGAAQQEAREDAFLRRRQERRDMIDQDRRLFQNQGPWATPWPSPLESVPAGEQGNMPATPGESLPDWDNGWYFRGW
jgi:hypothetical protein